MSSVSLNKSSDFFGDNGPDHFSSSGTCNRIFRIFLDCLKNGDPNTVMVSPVQGATGFTFLCEMDAGDERLRGVLKWQNSEQARNEAYSTAVIGRYGFNTPTLLPVEDRELSRGLASFGTKIKPAMPAPESNGDYPLSLIAMNKLKGHTFKEVVKKGEFFSLPIAEQKEMFFAFGKISVFDLFIGNDDRIIRIEKDFSGEFLRGVEEGNVSPLKASPQMNYGNVMLRIDREKHQAHLRDIYFIDNASNPCLFKVKSEIKGVDLSDWGNFYGDEEPADKSTLVSLPPNGDKRENYNRLFSLAFKKIFTRPELFAEHAFISISQAIEELIAEIPASKALWSTISAEDKREMQMSLLEGIAEGKKCLLSDQGKRICDIDPIGPDRLDLIQRNIDFLNSIIGCK
ncbi:MAG TPA: hypothetical protein VIJ14_07035 [Rhabdochlamydiaceae bacterium]